MRRRDRRGAVLRAGGQRRPGSTPTSGARTCAGARILPLASALGGLPALLCVGFGDCAAACPFGAIEMVDEFPVVDPVACVGCGTCVRTCPKKIIGLLPREARVWVACSTKDSGKRVKEICQAGCISCKMCVKACPAKAVNLEEIVTIDHSACVAYGPGCGEARGAEKCPRQDLQALSSRRGGGAAS